MRDIPQSGFPQLLWMVLEEKDEMPCHGIEWKRGPRTPCGFAVARISLPDDEHIDVCKRCLRELKRRDREAYRNAMGAVMDGDVPAVQVFHFA